MSAKKDESRKIRTSWKHGVDHQDNMDDVNNLRVPNNLANVDN